MVWPYQQDGRKQLAKADHVFRGKGKHYGCPKKRWIENIKADMKIQNTSEELTNDCVPWRAAPT